MSKLYNCVLG